MKAEWVQDGMASWVLYLSDDAARFHEGIASVFKLGNHKTWIVHLMAYSTGTHKQRYRNRTAAQSAAARAVLVHQEAVQAAVKEMVEQGQQVRKGK